MTLAELRESPHVGPMERTVPVCVAGKLVAEYEALDVEYLDAERAAGGDDGERSNRREVDGPSEALQIAQRMEALHEKMLAHEVMVRLRRKRTTDWGAYVEAHPVRMQPGQHTVYCTSRLDRDDESTGDCEGCAPVLDDMRHGVNVDELAHDVGDWVVALNDEPASADDFEQIVAASASLGDLRGLARTVALMHEGQSLVPKSRLTLHIEEMNAAASKRRERTE
jgi:hypothetical protein